MGFVACENAEAENLLTSEFADAEGAGYAMPDLCLELAILELVVLELEFL